MRNAGGQLRLSELRLRCSARFVRLQMFGLQTATQAERRTWALARCAVLSFGRFYYVHGRGLAVLMMARAAFELLLVPRTCVLAPVADVPHAWPWPAGRVVMAKRH